VRFAMNRGYQTLAVVLLLLLAAFAASARPTFGKHGLVVSDSDLASQAGIRTLLAGGNAADAAVTIAFVLAVTRPYYASLGGGGFMLVRFRKEVLALDHRERAPLRSTPGMFLKSKDPHASINGGLAVATPGTVFGLYALHKRYGRLSWKRDIEPAVQLAAGGFMVTEEFARMINENRKRFSPAGQRYFSKHDRPYEVGDILRQSQLAAALKLIQQHGAEGFYRNAVARDIAATVRRAGGILDERDLAAYQPRWLTPLHAKVFGADIHSMPPPSSGGILLISELKMAEASKLNRFMPFSVSELHGMAEIMSRAFADRQYLADPNFMKVLPEQIYSDRRVRAWVQTIDLEKKIAFDPQSNSIPQAAREPLLKDELPHTTHYSILDRDRNAVAATTTVNGSYGSGLITEQFGIVLNNEMDDFTTKLGQPNLFGLTQSSLNEIRPGKTPLSSMTPTIVERGGRLFMVLGASGGPSIVNSVFQVVYRALNFPDYDIDELVQAPRIHHQYGPDKLFYDKMLAPEVRRALEARGHTLSGRSGGRVYAIRVTPEGLYEGAFDSREEGGSASY
jgi:gamma-glutamyltranspeptidase / glutathione hydrolase